MTASSNNPVDFLAPAIDRLHVLAGEFADLGTLAVGAEGARPQDAAETLVRVVAQHVSGTAAASITTRRGKRLVTAAASDGRAVAADETQDRLHSGPSVDALAANNVVDVPDLRHDARWPDFGRIAAEKLGVAAVLSFRLATDSSDRAGALNLYAAEAHAFDEAALHTGMLFASYGGLLMDAAAARTKVANLQCALESSRAIGVALGILMSRYKVTHDQAFELLSATSQRMHRKLRDIAAVVAETGELPGVHD